MLFDRPKKQKCTCCKLAFEYYNADEMDAYLEEVAKHVAAIVKRNAETIADHKREVAVLKLAIGDLKP